MSQVVRLGDYCVKIGSGATPRGGKAAYLDHGPVALIRSQNVHNSGFSLQGLAFIDDAQARKLDGVKVEAGDVLLNITGDSVARVCQAPYALTGSRVNQHVAIIRPDAEKMDAGFLRYYLVQPIFQDFMLGMASVGATRNALTKGMIEAFQIELPPLAEQREIAATLGALDDKIELNRKTAATLEEMARALYRSWFVDFDPVRARAEGRAPAHMDEATAALFPDSFGEDGLPVGWRDHGLDEIADFLNGAALQKYPARVGEEYLPVIKIAELRNGLTTNSNRAALSVPAKYHIMDGDVLFSWSGSLLQKVWVDGPGALNQHLFGADVSPEMQEPLRANFRETILAPVLLESLARLNLGVPKTALLDAMRRVTDSVFASDVVQENRRLHNLMVHGVPVTFFQDGEERHSRVQLVDWTNGANDWRAVRQFDVAGKVARIPDVVLFLNGLPLVVVELKGVAGADVAAAWNQIDNYRRDIPDLFRTNLLTVISDGLHARYGSLSAGFDRYMTWRTVDGDTLVPKGSALELSALTKGLLAPRTLLNMLRWFVVFEDEGKGPIKKIAGYHQFHAVRKACEAILAARGAGGKGGVIWHTQGSGKSLLMTFLSGRVMRHPDMQNPTLLVLTDRNDLDNQLFATFARCKDLMGEEPVQAANTEHLQSLLDRNVGGIVFSTIQKFRPETGEAFPELTARSNVVVLVDEAHRTQYGFEAKLNKDTGEIRHGLAYQLRQALPNAVYVAFTGTPVELVGADTRGVFGDYIDVYDIAQAVADGATVPIYYEARVAKITLDEDVAATLDDEFDEATEMLAEGQASATAKKWARVEALVGADRRLDTVVQDILAHFDARLKAIDGKAMIVCMSRRICAEVYDRIIAARPDWHDDTDDTGAVKVVMTGAATDPAQLQPHIRSKTRQEAIRGRFKNPADPLKLVIVRDMWLTGFDAPCMHTLYVDKPMKGHGLMQAIARVNRVFANKPAGLVVDYIGIAAELKSALAHYSQTDQAQTGIDEGEAVAAFLDALDVARTQMHGFDYAAALRGTPGERLEVLPGAIEHILSKEGATKRFNDAVAALVKAYKLASGSPQATDYAEEVAFFAAVRSSLAKLEVEDRRNGGGSDFAIQQLINNAVASTEVVDILEACGFDRPDISMLSDAFMIELQNMQHRNLAVEALKKLLNGEISARTRTNVVQKELFSDRLEQAIARYHNRSVNALQILQELIALAKDLQGEPEDGLNSAERAFYDALAQNDSAVQIMSNDDLRVIATELVTTVRNTSGVDWWKKENVRAKMRVAIKRILKKYGYPPDLSAKAVELVLRQAQTLAMA